MKYLIAVLFFAFTVSAHTAEEKNCATYKFDKAHPRLTLKSSIALWTILNMGPDDVFIMSKEDKSFRLVIPQHKEVKRTMFFGDKAHTYTLNLSANGQAAKVQVCSE